MFSNYCIMPYCTKNIQISLRGVLVILTALEMFRQLLVMINESQFSPSFDISSSTNSLSINER